MPDASQAVALAPSQHPPIRGCPVCGVSMFAGRSRSDSAVYDTFRCPRCECVIEQAPHRPHCRPPAIVNPAP